MPLFWLGLSFTAGIFASATMDFPKSLWLTGSIIGLALAAIEYLLTRRSTHMLRSRKLFGLTFGSLLAVFSLGGLRYQIQLPNFTSADLGFYQPNKDASLTGTIISYPEISNTSSVAILRAEEILVSGKPVAVKGKLELRLPGGFHLIYGDQLKLTGNLTSTLPAGAPFHSSYLARRGIISRMAYPKIETLGSGRGSRIMAWIYHIRTAAHDFLQSQLPFQESALLSGILLGIEWNIPRYLEDAYRVTGTIHIIAISGFNISLIAWLVIRTFRRIFKPLWASIWALTAIGFYTIMVGAEPPVVRAALMGAMAIPAYFIGRRVIGIHSLVLAAAMMLVFNPTLLWDIGFQLSFLATLGLMVIADPLLQFIREKAERKSKEPETSRGAPLRELIISTLAAQFTVSPVLLNMDAAFHLYSLPANLLILPLQPMLMVLGGIAVFTGIILPPLGGMLIKLAWPIAAFCNQTALRVGLLPGAEVSAPEVSSILSTALVILALTFFTRLQIRQITHPKPEKDR